MALNNNYNQINYINHINQNNPLNQLNQINNNNENIQNNQNQPHIHLINIKIICYDDNIIDGDNEHHFYACLPSFITIKNMKGKIDEIWSPQLRGEQYNLKLNDIYLNNVDYTLQEHNIDNGNVLIIEKL